MAKQVITNGYVSINSVNLSSFVKSMTLTYSADQVDITSMGSSTHTKTPALLDWSVSIEFFQDYAAGSIDATLWPLVGAAAFPIELRPNAGTVSATNPKFTGNAVLPSYQPVGGSVGDAIMAPITLQAAGPLTRGIV